VITENVKIVLLVFSSVALLIDVNLEVILCDLIIEFTFKPVTPVIWLLRRQTSGGSLFRASLDK
jgi:hypothetical protein